MGQKSSACRKHKLHVEDADDELRFLPSAKSWISGKTKAREPKRKKFLKLTKWFRLLQWSDSQRSSSGSPYLCSPNKGQKASVAASFGREMYLRRLGIQDGTIAPQEVKRKSMTLSRLEMQDDVIVEPEAKLGHTTSELDSEFCDTELSVNSGSDATSFTSGAPELLTHRRNQEDRARMKFLQKLSYERVWLPKSQRPPSHQTLIIFDWDDTLLCTSYLNKFGRCGLELLPHDIQQTLREAGKIAAKLLDLASSLGQTFIITNAITGWVEQSANFWAPCMLPSLKKVRIVSARSRYEAEYPHDVSKWKAETFLEVRRCLDSQVITNLISLGDSQYEMDATQAMAKEFQQASIKLLKFNPCPYPEDLLKQLRMVTKDFEQIVGSGSNISIKLEKCDD